MGLPGSPTEEWPSVHLALMFLFPQSHALDPPLLGLRHWGTDSCPEAVQEQPSSPSQRHPLLVVTNIDNFVFCRDFLSSNLSHLEFVRTCSQMAPY